MHNYQLPGLRAVFVIVIPSVDDHSIGKLDGGTVRRVEGWRSPELAGKGSQLRKVGRVLV